MKSNEDAAPNPPNLKKNYIKQKILKSLITNLY